MKTRSFGTLLVALALFLSLGAVSAVRGQETNTKLTSKQLRTLIATAKTPEDHQKLAAYYREKAEEAKADAAEHQKMLEAYNQNPVTHPLAKGVGGPAAHCSTMIRLFNDEAKEDLALAAEHEQMAKAASHEH